MLPQGPRLPATRINVPAPIDVPVEAPVEAPGPNRPQLRRLLNEQDYIGAMDFIRAEMRRGVKEQELAGEYPQAVNGGLVQARALMEQGDFSKAAFQLKTVRDSYPRSPELQKQIVASPDQITADIDLCTQNLMEAGLVAYRAGELATALGIWQKILAVDPQHRAAKNASQTTRQQLLKLETLNNKN